MLVKSIHHIGITVHNLEKTVDFYHNIMGLEMIVPPSKPFKEIDNGKPLGVEGAIVRTCLFRVTKEHVIEFLEYEPKPLNKKPVAMNTLGAHHIALLVDHIDEYVKKLEKLNIEFLYEPLVIQNGYYKGFKWVYFRDPDGIIVELMQEPGLNKKIL